MSELKDYDIMDIEAIDDERLEKSESGIIQATRVYIKSEVDKVIAELKHRRDGAFGLTNSGITLDDLSETARKAIDRQKYKRCLDKANWCKSKQTYLHSLTRIYSDKELWEYASDYWIKWSKHWLELAEKFKEAK